jgi:hypothetical protein
MFHNIREVVLTFNHPGSVFGDPVAAFSFAGEELFVLIKGFHDL